MRQPQHGSSPEPRSPGQSQGIGRPPLLKIYSLQWTLLMMLAAMTVLLPSADRLALLISFLLGGLTALIPNAYFAVQAYRYRGARSAAAVTASFYRGEAGKFVMTTVLFAAIFASYQALVVWALFTAWIVMWLANLVSAVFIARY